MEAKRGRREDRGRGRRGSEVGWAIEKIFEKRDRRGLGVLRKSRRSREVSRILPYGEQNRSSEVHAKSKGHIRLLGRSAPNERRKDDTAEKRPVWV